MSLLPQLPPVTGWICVLLVGLAVVRLWAKRRRLNRRYEKLPQADMCAAAFELFSSTHLTLSQRVSQTVIRMTEKFADRKLVVEGIGFTRKVLVFDPSYVEQVLKSPICLEKPSDYDQMRVCVGNALAVADVPTWKAHRRIASGAFTSTAVNGFVPVFVECALRLRDLLLASRTKEGQVSDLFPPCERAMLDIVCLAAVGLPLEQVERGDQRAGRAPFHFVRTLRAGTHSIFARAFNLLYRRGWIFRLTRLSRETDRQIRRLHVFLETQITDRLERRRTARKQPAESDPSDLEDECGQQTRYYARMRPGMCFLDLLLDTHLQQQSLELPPAKRLDRLAIREEMIMFSFGGFDTSSVVLFNTLYLLGLHPDAQQRAFDEVLEVLGPDGEDDVQPEQVSQLIYLEACIKEAMRLIPTVPFIARTVTADLLLDDGVCIPGQTTAAIPIQALLLSGRHFDEPLAYRPERFLGAKQMPAYVPFSLGARNCIGMRFAMVELKVTLALLLRRLRFESLLPFDQLRHWTGVVMKPDLPVPVRVFDRCPAHS